MNFPLTTESRMLNSSTKPIHRNQLIVIVIHEYAGDFHQSFFIDTFYRAIEIMKTILAGGLSIARCKIYACHQGQLQVSLNVVSKWVLNWLFYVIKDYSTVFLLITIQHQPILLYLLKLNQIKRGTSKQLVVAYVWVVVKADPNCTGLLVLSQLTFRQSKLFERRLCSIVYCFAFVN